MLLRKEKSNEKKRVIILTAAYFVICIIAGIERVVGISEELNWFIILLGVFIFPVVLWIYWYKYIKSYVGLDVHVSIRGEKYWFYLILTIVYIYGMCSLLRFRELVDYVTNNIKLVDGLYICIGIKLILFVIWMLFWGSVVNCSRSFVNDYTIHKRIIVCFVYILMGVVLIYFNKIQENYVYKRTETVWYEKMIDYYENNESNSIKEQFGPVSRFSTK